MDCLTIVWILCAVAVLVLLMLVFVIVKGRRKESEEESSVTVPVTDSGSSIVPERQAVTIGNAQHIGARSEQQDSFGISSIDVKAMKERGVLAILADGMGGMSNGGALSKTAVQAALRSFQNEPPEKNDEATLLRILKRVRDAVRDTGITDGGTTFIAALIRNKELHFVSVGDSRICLMRNGGLIQLNREHVYGRELDDRAFNGLVSEQAAAKNPQRAALTSYIGKSGEMIIDRNLQPIPLYFGDKIVLMSDGVFNYLPESELTQLLRKEPMEAASSVQNAVIGRHNPSQDNMTIVILEI